MNNLIRALANYGAVASEDPIVLLEILTNVKGILCVDLVERAWAEVHRTHIFEHVEVALAASVAVIVDSSCVGLIALMARGAEGVLVGLHNIKFRAEVPTDLVSVAVLEGVIVVVLSRHKDGVEGRDTAAA